MFYRGQGQEGTWAWVCFGRVHTNGVPGEFPSLDVPVLASTDEQLEGVYVADVCHTFQMAFPGIQELGGNQGNDLASHDLQGTGQEMTYSKAITQAHLRLQDWRQQSPVEGPGS